MTGFWSKTIQTRNKVQISTVTVINHWNYLSRVAVISLSLTIF